jgi:hypothetical protein
VRKTGALVVGGLALLAAVAGLTQVPVTPGDALNPIDLNPIEAWFEVTVAPGLLERPEDGRVLLVFGRPGGREPRFEIGETGLDAAPVFGKDADALAPGKVVVLDRAAAAFPVQSLFHLPAGDYAAQAVFAFNRDLRLTDAPGNLYSAVKPVRFGLRTGNLARLELTRKVPAEQLPADTERVKYVKLRSELLSRFHGRPMYLRAGVLLPRDYGRDPDRRYPLRVHVGGYGTRFTAVRGFDRGDGPAFVTLHLDGAGPFGDPYQVKYV